MITGDSRGVDHEGIGRAEGLGDARDIVLEVHLCALLDKRLNERRGGQVVACHLITLAQKVAHEGTHTDPPYTDEV